MDAEGVGGCNSQQIVTRLLPKHECVVQATSSWDGLQHIIPVSMLANNNNNNNVIFAFFYFYFIIVVVVVI